MDDCSKPSALMPSFANNSNKLSRIALSGIYLLIAVLFQLASTTAYAACSARPFSSAEDNVIGAYIAYYGRPADPGGLDYWADRLRREGSLDSIIEAFGESQEFDQRFGALNNADLVTNLYEQLFGRRPDEEGLLFYELFLGLGLMSLQSISLDILFGVQNEDVTIVNNRKNVAKYYISQLESLNMADLEPSADTLSALVAGITVDATTANTACADIDEIIGNSGNYLKGLFATGKGQKGIILIRGSKGKEAVAISNDDGSFRVDVSSLTAPYKMRAESVNKETVFYSYSETKDYTNINTFTTLLFKDALRNDTLESIFKNNNPLSPEISTHVKLS